MGSVFGSKNGGLGLFLDSLVLLAFFDAKQATRNYFIDVSARQVGKPLAPKRYEGHAMDTLEKNLGTKS